MELENASTSLPDKESHFSKGTFQFCDARKEIGLEYSVVGLEWEPLFRRISEMKNVGENSSKLKI